MELFSTELYYILVNGERSLWINRLTGSFKNKINASPTPRGGICMGTVYGFIGKLEFGENTEPRLVFIKQRALVGKLRGSEVYKIHSVVTIPLASDVELTMEPCPKNHKKHNQPNNQGANPMTISHNVETVKTHVTVPETRNLLKVKPVPVSTQGSEPRIYNKPTEKLEKVERRMLEEFHKMFTEADSFYYSPKYDLTSSVQRSVLNSENNEGKTTVIPGWYSGDSRFFWNYHMMNALIHSKDHELDDWIQPIIQGFIQFEHCNIDHLFDPVGPGAINVRGEIDLWIISRRSRFRAGTRYLRRGVDEAGKVANYVETEQIMIFKQHVISFIQTRGSIPVFWSQPGFRYRPPPRLERSADENYSAFRKHIEEEGGIYGPIVVVNLVEKTGKEKVLGDAYLANVLKHNSADVSYVTFDFHEHCRGMHFENVQLLIDKLDEKLKVMNYCWVDPYGVVMKQAGACRINCVDCLDRTNVVQTMLGKHVLCLQMSKLGLLANWEIGLPDKVKRKLQSMWANNGDTISKQYAGTNALKSDYTRTGERRIAGAFKDGMNSANRYYLNRFRDANRQAVLDIMLGIKKNITEDDLDGEKPGDERENTAEQIKMVIEDAKKCVIPKFEVVLGTWGLVNARENDPDTIDVDAIFILTETHYYFTEYDCNLDAITDTQKVDLRFVDSLELGFEPLTQPSSFWGLFGAGNNPQASTVPSLRINYKHNHELHFHQFRSSNMRFFNNVCVPIQQPEEMLEALKMIAESIRIAASILGNQLKLTQSAVLPARTSTSTVNPISTSWVHRYFSFGAPEAAAEVLADNNKKISAHSFQRFTPKYFRRSSAADIANRRAGPANKTPIMDILEPTGRQEVLPDMTFRNDKRVSSELPLLSLGYAPGATYDYRVVAQSPRHLERNVGLIPVQDDDLVLPSCGLVSISKESLRCDSSHSPPPPLLTPVLQHRNVGIADADPKSPGSGSPGSQPSSPELSGSKSTENQAALQRHRYSLPTPSLGAGISLCKRSITPEIKITEEPNASVPGSLLIPVTATLRGMSRSSEDVTQGSGKDIKKSVNALRTNNSSTGLAQLKPITSECMRSASDQDICGSLGNQMKGSHSDNTFIKGNSPFNIFTQQASAPPPFKKDLVLVPLGKLARGMQSLGANYLHPKKLRDTFKPQLKKDAEVLRQEDLEELRLLEEQKRNCKSLIIDL